MTEKEMKSIIRKNYVEAYIHYSFDCEITYGGNGINPSEALSVYKHLAKQFGISIEKPTDEEYKELEQDPYYQDLMLQFDRESLR